MLRVYHLLIGGVLMVLVPMGANFFGFNSSSQKNSPSNAQTTNVVSTSIPANGNTWNNILGKTVAPKGWQVKVCNGNTSLLCVSANGKNLGKVEIEVYPLEKRSDFQKILAKAGISPNFSSDKQNSQHQTQIVKALRNWVDGEYALLSQQRQQSYDNLTKTNQPKDDESKEKLQTSINFAPQPLEVVRLGKLLGIRYGFAGLKSEGGVIEKHLQYVTFDGKAMYVIKTAFAPDAIPGKFEKLENLAVFEPYLSAIVTNLQLSQQNSAVSSK